VRRGTAAVEFAAVLPLFVLLMMGTIEFGRMVMVQQILTNAAREGARTAILGGSSVSAAEQRVQDYLTGAGLPTASVSVTPDPATAQAGEAITVSVQLSFESVSWLSEPMFLAGETMAANCVMVFETNQ
jgi:Flp pilus assembly protein TadG